MGTSSSLAQIKALRHPIRYEAHRYWGRKPYNVVRYYIESFTSPGDIVLDPFGGSGVTAIEAALTGREGISVDINPMANFIAERLSPKLTDIVKLHNMGNELISSCYKETAWVYQTSCPMCSQLAEIVCIAWENGRPLRIFGKCNACRWQGGKDPDSDDLSLIDYTNHMEHDCWYPTDSLPKNADVDTVDKLFTKRNLYVLSKLLHHAQSIVEQETYKDILLAFSSNLPMASKLIPVNKVRLNKDRVPNGIWGVKRYWIPSLRVENNVLMYFRNRLRRLIAAKKEINSIVNEINNRIGKCSIVQGDARNLKGIDDGSIDFIFTDPPFGNSIPYMELSVLWASWLQMKLDFHNEIMPRNNEYDEYYAMLCDAFREVFRVLKPRGNMCLAFHSRNLNIWKSILTAARRAGFVLEQAVFQPDAEVTFTQATKNRMGALGGHFVYIYSKNKNNKLELFQYDLFTRDANTVIYDFIKFIIEENGASTTSFIYAKLIPYVVDSGLLDRINLRQLDIDRILKNNFKLITKTATKIKGESKELQQEFFWSIT